MRPHFLIPLLLALLCVTPIKAANKVVLVPVEASGWGESKRDATLAALGEAIAQVNGRTVAAANSMKRASVETGVDDESTYEWRKELKSEVADSLRGVVDSYEILSEKADGNGWEIAVRAMVAKLVSDGSKRKPLAIIPFTTGRGDISIFGESWDREEASRILTQLLVDKITSTRRFAVIDREFIDVTQQEASLKVNNPLMPMTQLLELANRLVAEYMIVGQLESITATRTTNYVEILKRDVYSDRASATVALRVIDVGSDQVKYAGTDVFYFADDEIPKSGGATAVGTKLLEVAAERITEAMLDAIYPISLVAIDGDIVTLNQGGDTISSGNLYELYRYGEKIIDPYTKESLGRSETLVGEISVERVNPKTSLGRIVRREPGEILEFKQKAFVLRLKKRQEDPNVELSRQRKQDRQNSISDRKQKTDDDW